MALDLRLELRSLPPPGSDIGALMRAWQRDLELRSESFAKEGICPPDFDFIFYNDGWKPGIPKGGTAPHNKKVLRRYFKDRGCDLSKTQVICIDMNVSKKLLKAKKKHWFA